MTPTADLIKTTSDGIEKILRERSEKYAVRGARLRIKGLIVQITLRLDDDDEKSIIKLTEVDREANSAKTKGDIVNILEKIREHFNA